MAIFRRIIIKAGLTALMVSLLLTTTGCIEAASSQGHTPGGSSKLGVVDSASTSTQEHIPGGSFELGVVDMEIQREPRFPLPSGFMPDSPYLDNRDPIEGWKSLTFPGAPLDVKHRITHKTLRLVAGERYDLSVHVRSADKVKLRVEFFANGVHQYDRTFTIRSSGKVKHLAIPFTAATGPLFTENEVAHTLAIWVSGTSDVQVDEISLNGPAGVSGDIKSTNLWVEPEHYPGIYEIGDSEYFILRSRGLQSERIRYEIVDPLNNEAVIHSGLLPPVDPDNAVREDRIPVPADERGYYLLRARFESGDGEVGNWVSRAYVVIDPATSDLHDPFFGMCMEEHGRFTKIDAFVSPDYLYHLVSKMGVGAVRIFASARPDMLSDDGRRYSFHELDAALDLASDYGIDPLVMLGSNIIGNIPDWMRSHSQKGDNSFDLTDGSTGSRLSGGNYFDVEDYGDYLARLFEHLYGKVGYYSLWNEPGHKFSREDFLRIAMKTDEVRNQWDPGAGLVGYSSTTRQDNGKGADEDYLPSFINGIAQDGGLDYVETLSYHSSHVFNFMGSDYDRRDHETGFSERLNRIITQAGKDPLPVWDTERGIPWYSPHQDRIDLREGRGQNLDVSPAGVTAKPVMEVAMQMPMVYAAAMAQGVERLFWFYLEAGPATMTRTKKQSGLFDAQMEPLPYIPVYDAMTEMLANSDFVRLWDNGNGVRFYLFQRGDDAVAVTYNWQQADSMLTLISPQANQVSVFDVMGKLLVTDDNASMQHEIAVGGSPKYIIMSGEHAADIEIL